MQRNTLRQIKRICEPISDLPQWIAMDWLHDLPRVHRFQQVWRSNTPLDRDWTERTSSVTDDQLWFPITPDKQFCFNLQWNSGCPLGSPLLDCDEDLCSQSHCASHPHAMCRVMNCGSCYPEFYDGSSGEVFQCYG
uniref:Uncharacterized protein n=3 Tax=Ciona intestinalis TaxID=7719 RepID=H2Y0D0_CIOIN